MNLNLFSFSPQKKFGGYYYIWQQFPLIKLLISYFSTVFIFHVNYLFVNIFKDKTNL